MFCIVVLLLALTWEKLPPSYYVVFQSLQQPQLTMQCPGVAVRGQPAVIVTDRHACECSALWVRMGLCFIYSDLFNFVF